jgi:hypothetical protein
VSNNSADGNQTDGIAVEVDDFNGEVSGNIATNNMGAGLSLAFDRFNGDIEGNTARDNDDVGIGLSIGGSTLSDVDIVGNTAENNGAEGMHLIFSGTGTSLVEVLNNTFAANNGGGREFLAENEDLPINGPTTYIELDGNTSANMPGVGAFNYEFDNEDIFDSEGEMILDLGTNVGSVENDDDVDFGEFPD